MDLITYALLKNKGAGGGVTPEEMGEAIEEALQDYLTTEGAEAMLESKADTTGEYDGITSGVAKQLATDKYTEDTEPYLFRPSASGKSDREYDEIVGGTVCWNQLVRNGNFESTNYWHKANMVDSISVSSNVLTATLISGEIESSYKYGIYQDIPALKDNNKYLCSMYVNPSVSTTMSLELGGSRVKTTPIFTANTWNKAFL
jgi:hypothetical protein